MSVPPKIQSRTLTSALTAPWHGRGNAVLHLVDLYRRGSSWPSVSVGIMSSSSFCKRP